jgi:signal transduction histidine kinase
VASSLRSRVIVASVLWTGGLLAFMHLLSPMVIHVLPGARDEHAAIMGTSIGTVLMLAGGYVAWRSIAPLRNLDAKVLAVTNGQASRIEGSYPSEVQPVIDRLNVMLDDRERAIRRAHTAAGDLAHALKTPLALLLREAHEARAAGHTDLADAITTHVQRMTAHVDRQLHRARVAASGPIGSERTSVTPCVDGLLRTMRQLHADRNLDISAMVPPGLEAPVRHEDLEEILGNLLDNACKWATARVVLAATPHHHCVRLTVDDDGPGLDDAAREAALQRGVRLDEAAPGSGLGLAIVRDLVDHYRGTIVLSESPLGGLRATVELATVGS